jgi:hypothetical protein
MSIITPAPAESAVTSAANATAEARIASGERSTGHLLVAEGYSTSSLSPDAPPVAARHRIAT